VLGFAALAAAAWNAWIVGVIVGGLGLAAHQGTQSRSLLISAAGDSAVAPPHVAGGQRRR